MLREPITIGVVGTGYWGKKCLDTVIGLFPEANFFAVEPDSQALSSISIDFPMVRVFDSVDSLLWNMSVDMAIVAVPARLHGVVAMKLLKGGVSVLVEKPFNLSSDELLLVHEYVGQGLTVNAGYLYAHHEMYRAVREIRKSNSLGNLVSIEARREGLGAFRRDVSCVRDLMVHDISICLSLAGTEEIDVRTAIAGVRLGTGFHADVAAFLRMGETVSISLLSSQLRTQRTRNTTFVFESGVVVIDESSGPHSFAVFELPRGLIRSSKGQPWDGNEYVTLEEGKPQFLEDSEGKSPLENSILAFVREVLNGVPNETGVDFAVKVNRLASDVESHLD